MAWYEGTMTKVNGALLAILDVKLPLNAKWTIYDSAAGTNCKVYRNYDAAANVDYYVKVNDNYTDYAEIELWQGWNAVTHVGVGQSLTLINGNTMKIYKEAGGCGLAVSDHRFVWVDFVCYNGTYIGQLSRYDTAKNMPIFLGALNPPGQNPLGFYGDGWTVGWWCLFDEGGASREIFPYSKDAYSTPKTIAGNYIVFEHPVYNSVTYLLMGALTGVAHYSAFAGPTPTNNDIVTLNGVDWVFIGHGDRWSLIRKD